MSSIKSSGHRRKGGTHGSLSKAGKTRDRTKIDWKERALTKDGKPKRHKKKRHSPRVANRKRYRNQIVLEKKGNKQWSGNRDE